MIDFFVGSPLAVAGSSLLAAMVVLFLAAALGRRSDLRKRRAWSQRALAAVVVALAAFWWSSYFDDQAQAVAAADLLTSNQPDALALGRSRLKDALADANRSVLLATLWTCFASFRLFLLFVPAPDLHEDRRHASDTEKVEAPA